MDIQVPPYEPTGMRLLWEPDSAIAVHHELGTATIAANRDGLVSLARHLLTLAQSNVPFGQHMHLDDSNGLEAGSIELLVELTDI